MAGHKTPSGVEKKRKSKKRKSRLEVSSSSESDSDVAATKKAIPKAVEEEEEEPAQTPETPAGNSLSKSSKKEKKKNKAARDEEQGDSDTPMTDAIPTQSTTPKTSAKSTQLQQSQDNFTAIYLRKITTELADDLDKVREAQDFKASSVSMLIHALKQGESLFNVEEKRRVVGAAAAGR
ncbi:hypothetical protein N0V83_008141 [Neocucurbitaria cava]|uniref:Ribosome assembly protein 3 n=1 Tax=Neocucurbitaria cava TaxID=798079 RepID=A0A9W8Y312_9PLEO|nr:hypothetical protein N0V83_008141 [Neocucurbitaria cava]